VLLPQDADGRSSASTGGGLLTLGAAQVAVLRRQAADRSRSAVATTNSSASPSYGTDTFSAVF